MRRASVIALLVSVTALAPLSAHATPEASASGAEADTAPTAQPAPAAAATPLALKAEPTGASPHASSDLGIATKVGACALILGAAAWAFKRRRSAAKADPGAKGALSLVSRLPLGARLEVCVIEVEGQRLVLGVTPQSICTLSVAGLEGALVDTDPGPIEPRATEPRERPTLGAPAQRADRDERPAEDDEPRPSWREINQTGVQRISKAPPEALLRLFERNRSAEPASERESERESEPGPQPERPSAPVERSEARRHRQETARPRPAGARPTLEGQARGLASLRAKR